MSLDATRWAWTRTGLRPLQKLVLLVIADRAGADDVAYPSYEQLMDDTGADRKTVWQALKALQAAGLISDTGIRTGKTGQIVVWKLNGVEHRNSSKKGTVNPPESNRENDIKSSENGTVKEFQKGNGSKNGTVPFFPSNSSENGTRNQSRNHRGKYSPITPSSDPGKEKPKTGTRLPDDWTLPDEWLNWAATNTTIPPTKIPAIADGFKDYWIAKAGKDGRKADWFATWRNWIRREAERYGGPHEARNPIPDRPKSKSQEFDEFMRKIDDRIERLREHEQRVSGVGSDLWGEMESPMD